MSDTFIQRFGLVPGKVILNDFPKTARFGLSLILKDLMDKDYIKQDNQEVWKYIDNEIQRIGRLEDDKFTSFHERLNDLPWTCMYGLIERIYQRLLVEVTSWYEDEKQLVMSLQDVQKYFCEEINTLLEEENIAFEFKEGKFQRKGYLRTQKAIHSGFSVLSDPALIYAKQHYNKALAFYRDTEKQDLENIVKESICAIESTLSILFSDKIVNNFENVIRKLSGNGNKQIPAPLVESIIKIYGYRNCANGVAHANSMGLKVSEKEAEFILSISADIITYLYSLLKADEKDEIPF